MNFVEAFTEEFEKMAGLKETMKFIRLAKQYKVNPLRAAKEPRLGHFLGEVSSREAKVAELSKLDPTTKISPYKTVKDEIFWQNLNIPKYRQMAGLGPR